MKISPADIRAAHKAGFVNQKQVRKELLDRLKQRREWKKPKEYPMYSLGMATATAYAVQMSSSGYYSEGRYYPQPNCFGISSYSES